jgi:hypothetical protein
MGRCSSFLALLLCCMLARAQRVELRLSVLDSLERTPIAGVQVEWGQERSTLTNEAGECWITWEASTAMEIRLSHTSYRKRVLLLSGDDVERDAGVKVLMVAKVTELEPVPVMRPKPEVIFQRTDLHAADLLVNDDGIWVLAYEHPRMLRTEAEQGVEILRDVRIVLLDSAYTEKASAPVPEDVLGLRRDLHNTVVVEGTTRAFGVAQTNDDIELVPFGLEDLRQRVLPWTDSIPGWVLGSNTDQVMPSFDHIAYDPPRDSLERVCSIVDTFMLQLFRSEYKYLRGPEKVVAMNLASELGVDKEVVAGYMSGFQRNIWFKPVYAPLFVVGDTLLVFDHANGALRKYDRHFKEAGRTRLPYLDKVQGRDWAGRILQDRATQKLYAIFARNGFQWIRCVDAGTGTMGDRQRITYKYPERVQVYNDAVYYVYRPYESLQKRSIYRERLN